MAETYMSKAGYEKLQKDLEKLKEEKKQLSVEIADTRAQGDLSENFGYHAARAKQAEVLKRINEIEEKLKNARLTEDLKVNKDEVRIGAFVHLKDDDGDDYEYTLVGPDEADPLKGMISVMSPLAQSILGAKKGQEVTANLPNGQRKFKVIKVEYK
jgi:transcription elongation factor GreA